MPDDSPALPVPWPRRLAGMAAAMAAGALLALAFPRWDVEAMVWVWVWPLLGALWWGPRTRHPKRHAFFLGWLAGFTFFLLVLRWMRDIYGGGILLSMLGWTVLSAYLALFFGLWAVFATTVGRLDAGRLRGGPEDARSLAEAVWRSPALEVVRVAALNACAWAVLEWWRSWFLGGFGWNGVGVGLHRNLPLIQIAEFTGIHGLSLLPMFCSLALFGTAWRIRTRLVAAGKGPGALNLDFLLTLLLLVAVFLFGSRRLVALANARQPALVVQAALVQLNQSQAVKDDPSLVIDHLHSYFDEFTAALARHQEETAAKVRRMMRESSRGTLLLGPPDLVLLPEGAIGTTLRTQATGEFTAALLEAAGPQASLVSGVDDIIPGDPGYFYNTISVFPPGGGEVSTYRKMKLVPFGEFLPLRWLPPVQWLVGRVVPGDMTRGKSAEPLRVSVRGQAIDLVPLVCFEDTLGHHARRFVRDRVPQVIVNATNDAWFRDPAASLQQAANARFRCIELRRPMLRAANTGLSCAFDETGSLAVPGEPDAPLQHLVDPATGSPQVRGVLFAQVRPSLSQPLTFYARYGDAVPVAGGIIALLAWGGHWWRRRSRA